MAHAAAIRDHPMLELAPVSSVERIFSPNPAVAQPGQLRKFCNNLSGDIGMSLRRQQDAKARRREQR